MSEARLTNPNATSRVASRLALPAQDEDVAALRRAVIAKLTYAVGKDPVVATERDWFVATALSVRDRIVDRWMTSTRATHGENRKRVYYLSLEFLIGRLLIDSLNNLQMLEPMRAALAELGVDLDRLREVEPDAALGNGGLGRLAACFMESMATLAVAAYGYGIRYNHGLFRQVIRDGWQREYPESWLSLGNPWEFERPEVSHMIGFGGTVRRETRPDGSDHHIWEPAETVEAIAYDTPMVGWRGRHVNTLRLWSARAPDPLRLDTFNQGDHVGALAARARANAISQVLYPSEDTPAGQELRLRQEYFFSAASLHDLLYRHIRQHGDVRSLPEFAAIQLNDTHPAIAIAELMRMLIDVHDIPWKEAWAITTATFSYTNHTLMPEALEAWPVHLLERLLPRHMQIIFLTNLLHLDGLRAAGETDPALLSSVSLINEHNGRQVRMGALAFLGSHRVNGVSELHTNLMRATVFRDMHALYPDRIVNKTNGITFRRWLFEANPGLTSVLVDALGERVLDDASALEGFAAFAGDTAMHARLTEIRRANKVALSNRIMDRLRIRTDPDAIFDVQIKRIHEYKRQLLNILETVALYESMRAEPSREWVPRVKIFGGKAAAGYHRAKLIIKLINDVAAVVNNDPTLRGMLKVVFFPNYNVSRAEVIIPASDLSEQISTAGMEASGTGNMKLALNGALTIGTLDGANIEIRDRVGAENIFIFGLTAAEAEQRRARGLDARETIAGSLPLQRALDAIGSGLFSPSEPDRFRDLVDVLTYHDHFLVSADFDAYAAAQRQVAAKWRDQAAWWRSSILNTAGVGWFSSDRAIREYCDNVWNVKLSGVTPTVARGVKAALAWRASEADVAAIVGARHGDPFAILGPHRTESGLAIRALVPDAATVHVVGPGNGTATAMTCRDPAGFFEVLLPKGLAQGRYRLRAANAGGAWEFDDPFSFGPVLGAVDDYLLLEGTHQMLYQRLGAHLMTLEDVAGVHFAVWAPHARRVSVVGDFNAWDGRRHPMRKRIDSGLWEIFAPGIGEGAVYKFEIIAADTKLQPLKADPFGFAAESRPSTASVVARTDALTWTDATHMRARGNADPRRRPMAIYEVHLGSWRRDETGAFLSYDRIADALLPYVVDLGFTHIELMPINEHPLDDSWGYQPIGLFAPTRRFGDPAGFARFVDRAHAAGLGVILDWVPAHFPTDVHGLAHFDGSPLYEHADPRKGFHPDWNTAIYDFGRREVANMLAASALYWLDRFHIDGLRVDAVASMLYLDYSRRAGEWVPNEDGGRENRDAIGFLRQVNTLTYGLHPGSVTIAEESTDWPGVSRPVDTGGLGFGFKWNMGWMHDTLDYIGREPVHRRWHHDKLTFGLLYGFSENFILPISHDEVVHGKHSVLGRIPGDAWQRAATGRAYYAFMWGHPGKKLLFMGQEFGQLREWNFAGELDWHLLDEPLHAGVKQCVRDLNRLYRDIPALHARDCEAEGFQWIVVDDADQSVVAWLRRGDARDPPVAIVCNFTPVPRHGYRVGLPFSGRWREVMNTDAAVYAGSGMGNLGGVAATALPSHGMPASAELLLPPLATLYLQYDPG